MLLDSYHVFVFHRAAAASTYYGSCFPSLRFYFTVIHDIEISITLEILNCVLCDRCSRHPCLLLQFSKTVSSLYSVFIMEAGKYGK